MKHLMIDIETLGTGPKAVVLSAAGLWFDPHAGVDINKVTFRTQPKKCEVAFNLHLEANEQPDRLVTASTALWWIAQKQAAQQAILDGQDCCIPLADAKLTILGVLENAEHVWTNGPDFDAVILHDLLGKWPYRKNRCVRTMRNMFQGITPIDALEYGTAHDALSDCYYQANIICAIYSALDERSMP